MAFGVAQLQHRPAEEQLPPPRRSGMHDLRGRQVDLRGPQADAAHEPAVDHDPLAALQHQREAHRGREEVRASCIATRITTSPTIEAADQCKVWDDGRCSVSAVSVRSFHCQIFDPAYVRIKGQVRQSDGSSDPAGATVNGELPKIISVDDHVVEPPHLWQTWLPGRFRERGPKVERRGIGHMKHIGGGAYEQTFDETGPKADCWVYEDLVYINKRHVAAVGFDRDDMTMSPITYDEMRPGCYEPEGPHRRHGDELGRGVAVLPDVPPLLRPDLPRGEGPRARPRVRARVQRLDGRGVVRRQRRHADPADHHPALGRRARGRRGAPQRGARRARGVLQRDPAQPRAAVDPLGRVGSVLRRVRGDEHRRVHAHRVVVADAGDVGRRAGRRRGHVELQQRDGQPLRLPVLGRARALPRR